MSIDYRLDAKLDPSALIDLYDSVQWTEYTKDPQRLTAAVAASLAVLTAYDGQKLVGLARLVGDGLTIIYLQDILVAPNYQRRGIGRQLMQRLLAPFADVRQQVLMTDNEPGQIAFYESLGFTEIRDLPHPTRVYTKFA
ncbi:GNAT family N-acetyltransferase [Glutamicibacter uratoxydans]|uniref:GNAT family N-acetyltransferase n=1 Tax=Glutamicibacter uratoxydans TaxID=43667 RepID=UPI003D6EDA06